VSLSAEPGDYEVDHLIPLSLGGSNYIRNLWPQSTRTSPWNSFVKDALERKLHELVCAGQLDLKTAPRFLECYTFDCLLNGCLLWFESQLLKQNVHIEIDPFRANLISLKVSEGSSMKCDGAACSRCAIW